MSLVIWADQVSCGRGYSQGEMRETGSETQCDGRWNRVRGGAEIKADFLRCVNLYVCVCLYSLVSVLWPKRIITSVCSAHRDLGFNSMTQLWIRNPERGRWRGSTSVGWVLTVCSWFKGWIWMILKFGKNLVQPNVVGHVGQSKFCNQEFESSESRHQSALTRRAVNFPPDVFPKLI